MNEYDLIKKIQKGDDESFAMMVDKYSRMINSIITSTRINYRTYHIDRDDLFQEGLIALLDAVKNYRDDKGAGFSTFAYIVIRRRIIRKQHEYINSMKNEYLSYDALSDPDYYLELSSSYVNDNPVSYVNNLDFEINVMKYYNSLDPIDKEILRLRRDDKSYKEIATELKTSSKKIDNHLYKIRKKLNRFLKRKKSD